MANKELPKEKIQELLKEIQQEIRCCKKSCDNMIKTLDNYLNKVKVDNKLNKLN